MISFDPTELTGLLELLRDCQGRVVAAVVPGTTGAEALTARLRDALPELRLEVAADAATPGQLGARATALGRGGDSLFVVPVDGRRLETEAARVDFWRRLNYQRERLASGAVRTCLVLDAENESALAMVADDLWDWAMVFRFPEAVMRPESPSIAVVQRPVVDTELEGELKALRARLRRALEVELPSERVARGFVAPLFVKLAKSGHEKEARELWEHELRHGDALTGMSEQQKAEILQARLPNLVFEDLLLASTLTMLAREAAPHFQEWGGKATEATLESLVGEKASQVAQALGRLKPRIEKRSLAERSVKALARKNLYDEEASNAETTLERQLIELLQEDRDLFVELLEKLDGVEVRAKRRSLAAGRDLKADQIVTGGYAIHVTGGNVYMVHGSRTPAEALGYDQIARDARQDPIRWREVILAAAQVGPLDVWELADALSFDDDSADSLTNAWGLHLAGNVVAESADLERVSPRNHRWLEGLRQRLAGLLASTQLPATERALAGSNLARLGDPRFDPDVWYLPADPVLGFLALPAARYPLGREPQHDPHATAYQRPKHTVDLPPFWIARWPVTVAQLRAFVEMAGFELGNINALTGIANQPTVWVSWDEAMAFCDWLTDRLHELAPLRAEAAVDPESRRFWQQIAANELRAALPTEIQWEAAARGPDARLYPWGEASPDDETANFAQSIGSPSTVGIYPRGRGPFGTEDQAGNVAEWCADVWDGNAYPLKPETSASESYESQNGPRERAVRGGSWWDGPIHLRAASRFGWSAGYRSWFRGFRVCISAPEP